MLCTYRDSAVASVAEKLREFMPRTLNRSLRTRTSAKPARDKSNRRVRDAYKQKIGADEAVLAHIPVAGGGDGLAVTATRAVRALAARADHPLGTVSASGSPWKSPVVPAAIGLAILGVAAGVLFWRRRADAPRPGR